MTYLTALTALAAALHLYDWWSTRTILAKGGVELNSVSRHGIDLLGVDGYLGTKFVLATGATYWVGTGSIWLALGLVLFYVGIAVYNSRSV